MSHMITNEQKLNDIIFADRNKEYGAYVLRSEYGHTVLKSLSMMILGVGTIASVALYMNQQNQPEENLAGQVFIPDSVYVVRFTQEEKKMEQQTAEASKEKSATTEKAEESKTERAVIVDSTLVTAPTSTNISAAVVASVALPGNGTSSTITTGNIAGGLVGKPDTSVVQPYTVDSAPEFEGGYSALTRFVARNLKYPEPAYELGEEGIVYVKFVVDERGKVGRLSLLNTAGYGMDEEALRVIALIPNFKSPAKVKGIAVKSYYQLPIRFRFK